MGIEDVPTLKVSRQDMERARVEVERHNTAPSERETEKIKTTRFLQEERKRKNTIPVGRITLELPSYEDVRILNEWMRHSRRLAVYVNVTPRMSVRIKEILLIDGGISWSCVMHEDERSETTIEVKAGSLLSIKL